MEEGTFMKVTGKRSKQLVVLLTGVMAISTVVELEYLEVIGGRGMVLNLSAYKTYCKA